ncbi:MAG: gliding motility-associated C-terminal domain-containing protein [Marinifilaceae bacterium]|jgi:gliding motility-associated-like protein|nr:gliding motility-associated C-terminal domain-containing protein [Marinifilaceae bacterium]
MKKNVKLILFVFSLVLSLNSQARDFYWVGGSGSYNDINSWSDRPGGKINPYAAIPDKDDDVYFDKYSFPTPGAEVLITDVARCANMYWDGVTNKPTLKTDVNPAHYLVIYGGVQFDPDMIIDLDRSLFFRSSKDANIIDFAGNDFDGDLVFENNGSWTLQGNTNLLDNDLIIKQGNLSINGQLSCSSIISSSDVSRSLRLNNSEINLSKATGNAIDFNTVNFVFSANTSKINITGQDAVLNIAGASFINFNNVTFKKDAGIVNASLLAEFRNVSFEKNSSLTGPNNFGNLVLAKGTNCVINDISLQKVKNKLTAIGTCSEYITISGPNIGANINAKDVELVYCRVQNITATGKGIPFVADKSINLGGNNADWTFNPPITADFTWTGNINREWDLPGNWDLNCVPTRLNNIRIPAGKQVDITSNAECKNFVVDNSAIVNGDGNLQVFGNFETGIADWNFIGSTNLKSTAATNCNIRINEPINGTFIIDSESTYTLLADITTTNGFDLLKGKLVLAGNELITNKLTAIGSGVRSIDLRNSTIRIKNGGAKAWELSGNNIILESTNSDILMEGANSEFYNNTTVLVQYGNLKFLDAASKSILKNEGGGIPSFMEVNFAGNADFFGDHQSEKFIFKKGHEYIFSKNSEQKVLANNGLIAKGDCAANIKFTCLDGVAYFECDDQMNDIEYVRIDGIQVRGGLIGAGNKLQAKSSIGERGYEGWEFINNKLPETVNWTGAGRDNNWFNAQNWSNNCVPTRVDNVVFRAANVVAGGSFEVSISDTENSAECADINFINPGAIRFTGDTELKVFGSVDFSSLPNANYSYTGQFIFKSTATEDINFNALNLNNELVFEGMVQPDGTNLGGVWNLLSAVNTTKDIDLNCGELNVGDFDLTAKDVFSNYSNDFPRKLRLANTNLNIASLELSALGIDLIKGNSTINISSNNGLHVYDGDRLIEFNDVNFTATTGYTEVEVLPVDVSFNNITTSSNMSFIGSPADGIGYRANSLSLSVGKTINFESEIIYEFGNLIANGTCDGSVDITSDNPALPAIFQAKAGVLNITLQKVNISNIEAQPVGVWTADNSFGLGVTDGWNFINTPTGRDLYWIGGTGDWDDKNHWSYTSGNVGGVIACVPTAKDNVHFDNKSFTANNQVVSMGSGDVKCNSMTWDGAGARTPIFRKGTVAASAVYIHGSLEFDAGMTLDLDKDIPFYFRAEDAQTITSDGVNFSSDLYFQGAGGEWTFNDNIKTEGDCYVDLGKIILNTNEFECRSLTSDNITDGLFSRGIDISNSDLVITGKSDKDISLDLLTQATKNLQGLNFETTNSNIVFKEDAKIQVVGIKPHTITMHNLTFEKRGFISTVGPIIPTYNFVLMKGDGRIPGNAVFGNLEFTKGHSYEFGNTKTYQIGNLVADGTCYAPINIMSDRPSSQATVSSTKNMDLSFVEMSDMNADLATGVTYTAVNSHAVSNVSNWRIDGRVAAIDLYWTGNAGDSDWHNYQNWSKSFDGSTEGCVPTINDNVFFTSMSFLGNKEVRIDADFATCHNMNWDDDIDPSALFIVDNTLTIAGSLQLCTTMGIDMLGTMKFVGDETIDMKTINFADKSLDGDIIFDGNYKKWTILTGFRTSGTFKLEAGTVVASNKEFTFDKFESLGAKDPNAYREIDFTSSIITINSSAPQSWNLDLTTIGGAKFKGGHSKIDFPNGGELAVRTKAVADFTIDGLEFHNNGIFRVSGTGSGRVKTCEFHEQGQVFGDNEFNTLKFTLGYENNTIESGKIITVNNDLIMEGVRCSYIFLRASTPGNKANIHKPVGKFTRIFNAAITDIRATSGDGLTHPVYYKYSNDSSIGFALEKAGETNPPSVDEDFDKPYEEWCSNVAVLNHVEGFPINKNTSFEWYYSDDNVKPYVLIPAEAGPTITVNKSGFFKAKIIYDKSNSPAPCVLESVIEVKLNKTSDVRLVITPHNVKCYGQTNGEIIAKVPNPLHPVYTFSWKTETGEDITHKSSTVPATWTNSVGDLGAGKYTVTVVDGKNCEYSTNVKIFDAYELKLEDVVTKDLVCFNKPEGEIEITASGGTGTLTYKLNDKPAAVVNKALESGSYKVEVVDDNRCSQSRDVVLNSNPEITFDFLKTGLECNGTADGTLDPRLSGGVPAYTYKWTMGATFNSTDSKLTGLSGGKYKLEVTDAKACVYTSEFDVHEPEALSTRIFESQPVTCFGDTDGEIYVVAENGTPDYTYEIAGHTGTKGLFRNLSPQEYDVVIKDKNNCSLTKKIEVKTPSQLGCIVNDRIMPKCDNSSDGQINISPYGGNGGYEFSWTGPKDYRSVSQNIDKLESGEYKLSMVDAKNCQHTTDVDLYLGIPLQAGLVAAQHESKDGKNDGAINIEILEGVPPYTFTLTGPAGYKLDSPADFDDHSLRVENLAAGKYDIEVQDFTKCRTLKRSVVINSPSSFGVYIQEIKPNGCVGSNDAELKAVVSKNSGTITYDWTGPGAFTANTNTIKNLAPGNYQLRVTMNGVTKNAFYDIAAASPLNVTVASFKNVSCNNAKDGEIDLNIDSGNARYTVLWETASKNGFLSSAKSIIQLAPDTYNYTVTTEYGCTAVGNQVITEPDPLELNITPTDITKAGEKDGEISVDVNEGTAPYTVNIWGPEGYSNKTPNSPDGIVDVDALAMGIYQVDIIDKNNCRIEKTTKIHEPTKFIAFVSDTTSVSCFGGADGAIEIQTKGESHPLNLQFYWVGPDHFSSTKQNITGLKAGRYRLSVLDMILDEVFNLSVEIKQPKQLIVEEWHKDITCAGRTDGFVNVHASGGTPPYRYEWMDATGAVSTEEDKNNLKAGNYNVTVIDSKGCRPKNPLPINFTNPKPLDVASKIMQPTCFGLEDGSIELTINNGTYPYFVNWENYGSVTPTIAGIKKGEYEYSIIDNEGCGTNGKITVGEPDSLIVEINDYSDILCYGAENGYAQAEITGGTLDYSITWSNDVTTALNENLTEGKYNIKVLDANGCKDTASVIINEPAKMYMDVQAVRPTTTDSYDGKIDIKAWGGVLDYTINWSHIAMTGLHEENLGTGKYNIEIVDKNNCVLDSLIVLEHLYDTKVRIPAAFTPNGDGYNDKWEIERIEYVQKVDILIYDRWGNTIYQFTGTGNQYLSEPWTGKNKGKDQAIGSYYYVVKLDDDSPLMGTVTIVK